MAKLGKIIGKIVGSILEWTLLLLILFAFAIRTSRFQTFLGQTVATFFAHEWKTTVRIDKIDVVFFDKVYVNGLYVQDLHKDTLAYVGELEVKLRSLNMVKNKLVLSSASVKQTVVKLKKYHGENDLNFQFIADFFASDKPDNSPSSNFRIEVEDVALQNIHFVFDLEDKEHDEKGMDYMHLDVSNVWLSANDFSSQRGVIKAKINSLRAREKAGFVLSNLSGRAQVSADSVYLARGHIKTPRSTIDIPLFTMITGTYGNFTEFVDSVSFRAKLAKSTVSMEDITQFAPMLWGMDQVVTLSANVTQKVKDMKIDDLVLSTGKNSKVVGSIQLPDFRTLNTTAPFNEYLKYLETSTEDLQNIRLPNKNNQAQYIELPLEIQRFGKIQLKELTLKGDYDNFNLSCQNLYSDVAQVRLNRGIQFTYDKNEDIFYYNRDSLNQDTIHVDYFDIGRLFNTTSLGIAQGEFVISGKGLTLDKFDIYRVEGKLDKVDALDYTYSNISLKNGQINTESFSGDVSVRDKNLALDYKGEIGFGKEQLFDFKAQIHNAQTDKLGWLAMDSTSLKGNIAVHISGTELDNYSGSIKVDSLAFARDTESFFINKFRLIAARSSLVDTIQIKSSVLDGRIIGKANFSDIADDFKKQFSAIFPALFKAEDESKLPIDRAITDEEFDYTITTKEINPILEVLIPGLSVEPNTTIEGYYSGFANALTLSLKSNQIKYTNLEFNNINLYHNAVGSKIDINYTVDLFKINDSLHFSKIQFDAGGANNQIASHLKWGVVGDANPGEVDWTTSLLSADDYIFQLNEGYFEMKNHPWKLVDSSAIHYNNHFISATGLAIQHENQRIELDGRVSDNPSDKMNINIHDFNLADISSVFGSDIELEGILNGSGSVSTPFTDLSLFGELNIQKLAINNDEVGDLDFKTNYINEKELITMEGNLFYRGNESIRFQGDYYLKRESNSLDMKAIFDNTNISFVNAFLDPDIVSNIKGIISGKLDIVGTIDHPIIKGKVNLFNAGAKLELFGTEFGLEGEIEADESGFYINNMPIYDQEGNAGSVVGTILHNNFKNWNFDLSFNLEDDALNKDPIHPSKSLPLKKFLVMNTKYKEGGLYYGRAYVTGTANIFGYTNNLDISVDVKTRKGTIINFPMYGQADLTDENGFIQFVSKDSIKTDLKEKIDFSGVNLNLNFDVTDEAEVKIIFDENTGDQISATGNGKIQVELDELDQLSLEGVYKVKSGEYNFAMGPVKKNFYIEEGGTVQWTGDPYDAALNLRTYYMVTASMADVMTNVITDQETNSKDVIYCYLDLTESLSKPAIAFDLAAPRASDASKAVLNRIKGNPDELNKQFFSLLLFRKFQPLNNSNPSKTGAGNAAFELVSNQINSVLDKVSKDYKLSVKLNNDQTNKQNTYEFGVSKGFLDDRLILSGNFGVNQVNSANKQGAASNFIGDVNLEYKLNESGTFRVNVFNQSNTYTIVSNKNLGLFMQGVGLHYQESFSNISDFKLIQFILDMFRKPDNRKYLGKKKQKRVPIPQKDLNATNTTLNEQDTNSK